MSEIADRNRLKKRQAAIKRSLLTREDAKKMLLNAGILTKQGNIAPFYRLKA